MNVAPPLGEVSTQGNLLLVALSATEACPAISASERFQQLALHFTDPVQYDYEVIRGIFLEDETIAERSRETGQDRATVSATARRFLEVGMLGLIDRRAAARESKTALRPRVAILASSVSASVGAAAATRPARYWASSSPSSTPRLAPCP